jgi:hypothetical protein
LRGLRSSFVRVEACWLLAVAVLASCGVDDWVAPCRDSQASEDGDSCDVQVMVDFPNLFDHEGKKVLPTFISHLYGERMPVARVAITNRGPAVNLLVSSDLAIYGAPAYGNVFLERVGEYDATVSRVVRRLFAIVRSRAAIARTSP